MRNLLSRAGTVLVSFSAGAVNNTALGDPQYQGEPAHLYYFEVYPKDGITLEFAANRICPDDKIKIQNFESSAEYPSVDTGKPQKVRIINIYADMSSLCSNMPRGNVKKILKISPVATQMTHIFVTAGDGVSTALKSK